MDVILSFILHSSVQKLQNKDKRKQKRVESMRRLYMQCKAPGEISLIILQRFHLISVTTATTVQSLCLKLESLTLKIPARDPDGLEHWEQEMDELVKWTHSLSLKELDDL